MRVLPEIKAALDILVRLCSVYEAQEARIKLLEASNAKLKGGIDALKEAKQRTKQRVEALQDDNGSLKESITALKR